MPSPKHASAFLKDIEILGARQHNLKNISLNIPRIGLSVITGPSGSGKSSLAFNTLFAEGQRRFVESLSSYTRQFLEKHEKPDVDAIKNLSPTVALEQKNYTKNSRSTVGTSTEIYDYLRLLFSKAGQMIDPKSGRTVKKDLPSEISDEAWKEKGDKIFVFYPFTPPSQSEKNSEKSFDPRQFLLEKGFSKILADEKSLELIEIESADSKKLFKKDALWVLVDRFPKEESEINRCSEAIATSYHYGSGRCRVVVAEDSKISWDRVCSEFPSVDGGLTRFPESSPLLFSFNSPAGACPDCKGFGNILKIDRNLVVPRPQLSISQGAIEPLTKPSAKDWYKELLSFCQKKKISIHLPYEKLSEAHIELIWKGEGDFQGINGIFEELDDYKYKMQVRVFLSRYRSPFPCTGCKGARLKKEALQVYIQKKNIWDLSQLSIEDLQKWFQKTEFSKYEKSVAHEIFKQIENRLDFLMRVGLDYLTLSRLTKTLSGGEAQRIALSNQLGARLTQTCYVLDEPSIGLHTHDTEKLIGILKDLADLRNTVVVVEHDTDIIRSAEHLIDLGPEAGEKGGELLYAGPSKDFEKKGSKNSHTYQFMMGQDQIPIPLRRRLQRMEELQKTINWLSIEGCSSFNLKNVDLKIPLNTLTCITGVSGSGKSTAVRKTLYPALAKLFQQAALDVGEYKRISGFEPIKDIVLISQEPIGRSPRSNPVTYIRAFDEIRNIFSQTKEAQRHKFHAGFFSFNVPGGRCEHCEGEGYNRVEMVFMEDLFILCDHCEGKRFKPEILKVTYKEKNIVDVLNLTINEAIIFFHESNKLRRMLGVLEKVGLGYLRLGQPATTLSGGESQRLKIARELMDIDRSGLFYVLDEPTTGLHLRDIKTLNRVLHHLVENGNTVCVIEHSLDFIKTADWVIDFGPGGGVHGGNIVAEGTPEKIAKAKNSLTGKYLKEILKDSPQLEWKEILLEKRV
jgi:excinuclease ABC subunit A